MKAEGCKSCGDRVSAGKRISPELIDEALAGLARVRRLRLVNEEEYEYRLSRCRECRYLELGATCLQCGCIVQVRAKLADASCPFPQNNRWGRGGRR